jgi:hypothetical protein
LTFKAAKVQEKAEGTRESRYKAQSRSDEIQNTKDKVTNYTCVLLLKFFDEPASEAHDDSKNNYSHM